MRVINGILPITVAIACARKLFFNAYITQSMLDAMSHGKPG